MTRKKHEEPPCAWKLPVAAPNTTNPLATALTLYPVLETLVSFLSPFDLATLSRVSQAVYANIRMHDATAKANLLSKTLCPGIGYSVRKLNHCACPAKTFHQATGCAGDGFASESRPCVECGVNTCNECRIHVFYNYLTEDAGYDGRRWWAGFFFLRPVAVAAYPPKKGDVDAWYRPVEEMEPLHDQGRFHIPLGIYAIGDPEPIDRILDLDLGKQPLLTPLGRIQPPYSGIDIVSILNLTVTVRKELVCPSCFEERLKSGPLRCSCTLRKRFLDRWLCVGCYIDEHNADKDIASHKMIHSGGGGSHSHQCGCGASFEAGMQPRIVCNWCTGEVTGDWDDMDEEMQEEAEKTEDTEDDDGPDEEHSIADFADQEPGEHGYAKNRDGSLSVYVDGSRIRGERLSRAIIHGWRIEEGMSVDCICCLCEDGDKDGSRSSSSSNKGKVGEDDEEGEEWETEEDDDNEYEEDRDEDTDMDSTSSE